MGQPDPEEIRQDNREEVQKIKWKEPLNSASEDDLEKFMMNVLSRPTDFGEESFIFDDSDLVTATNFLQFSASKNFLRQKPFPKQVEIGINFLQEYCPAKGCTDIEWITDIPKKTSLNSIREHATLLKHGKCPRCKTTKSEFVNNGDLVDHYELVGLAGQRCITGDSLVLTDSGIVTMFEIMKDLPEDMSVYSGPSVVLETGKVVSAPFAFVGNDFTLKITLTNGFSIRCTKAHPLMTERRNGDREWVEAQYLTSGMRIPIIVGQDVWGHKQFSFKEIDIPDSRFPAEYRMADRESSILVLKKIMVPYFSEGKFSFFLPEAWIGPVSAMLCNLGIFNTIGNETNQGVRLLQIGCPVSAYLFHKMINNSVATDSDIAKLESEVVNEDGLVPIKREYPVLIRSVEPTGKKEYVYDFIVPGYNRFMANGILNHNSGKTALIGMISAYLTHLLLKTPNPSKTFGLTENMIITCTYAAVTFQQALHNVWNPYVKPNITQSPWFREYFKMMDYYSNRNPMPLYKSMDTFVFFYHKGLFLSPYTPDRRTLRGATRGIAVIDELGWFDTNNTSKENSGVRANSEETVAALFNSLGTLIQEHSRLRKKGHNTIPNPVMMNISSPSSKTDGICTRYNMVHEDPQMFGFHYPTWEMSPKYERKHQLIVSAFNKNPINAARDWGAEPPMSSNPFITNEDVFDSLVHENKNSRKNLIALTRKKITSNSGMPMTGATYHLTRNTEKTNRLMTIDAGSVNNSFVIAIGRVDPDTELPMLEGLGEIVPYPNREINFSSIFNEVINPLIEELGVIALVADRWQSKKLLHDAEAENEDLSSQEFSLKMPDFIGYRDAVMEGAMHLLKPEISIDEIMKAKVEDLNRLFENKPVAHFIHQNMTVVQTIKTVEKGYKLTDDLFRAVVLLHSYLSDPELRDDYMRGPSYEEDEERKRGGLGIVTKEGNNNSSGVSMVPGIGVTAGLGSGTNTGARTFSKTGS